MKFDKIIFESSENVQIVGIVGMGGSGKTTLAKELYNRKFNSLEKCSFLFEVRDASAKKDLHNKQKKLLEDFDLMGFSFDNVEDGKRILASRLRSLRLFIILDDVDHKDQLDALLPRIDSFGWGSLILVTSRELGILKSWGISSIYTMKGLNPDHASQLLCWHAFLQPFPHQGFEDLVKKFVMVCKGLPLSLKVFGGQLYGNSRDYWESQLNKISRLLPKDIKDTLKISYDALDKEEQQIFLDTACFFIGEEKSLAIAIWDGSGWSGVHSWETLLNKCMVELEDENRMRMHDHLRDLGKEIATTHSPNRLWLPQQITNIKREPKKVVEIRGIIAETTEFHEDFTVPCWFTAPCWSNFHTPFEECIEFVRSYCRKFRRFTPPYLRLELLVVRDHYFAEEFATQARDLVWLRWVDFQQRTLPSWLSLKNLRVLELCKAMKLKELWRDDADPALELRELLITGAHSFLSFPRSIGCLKHLKKISLGDLVEECPMGGLPKEFCLLQSLEHLQLQWCTSITSLPTRFGDLTNMRHLDLSFCGELRMLPLSFKELIHLEYIDLKNCYKLTFTSDILENMTKLEILNISQCRELEVFPRITNQGSLRKLYVKGMDSLREFPSNIGQLSQLQVLEIGSELLTSLPSSIGNLSSMRSLQIRQCRKLKSLPESIGGLHLLEHLHIGSKLLTSLPISLGNLSSLTNLQIRRCEKLESLPESIGGLHLLEHLGIATAGVKSLPKALEQLSNLRELYISNCPIRELTLGSGFISSSLHNLKFIDLRKTHVSRISISQQCCPCLETLTLLSNEHLIDIERLSISLKTISLSNCKMLKSISGICGLVNLQRLEIRGCENLDELPCFAELVSLKDFTISDDTEKHKQIKGLERCSSLETLSVRTMWKGAGIQSLKHMKRLRTLEISASCNILAIEPSLHTIEKWPSQTIIFARTDSDEYSTVKSFAFHNLTIVDSFLRWKAGRHILKSGHRHSSNAAAMACFVITSFCEAIEVYSAREDGGYPSHTLTVEKGKWVWISVFTDASSLMGIDIRPNTADHVEVWGTLVIGEQEKVVEGFHKLLLHLGKSNSV